MIFPVAYAQIDWHDFVVVETVDFQPNESGELMQIFVSTKRFDLKWFKSAPIE